MRTAANLGRERQRGARELVLLASEARRRARKREALI